MGVIFIVMTVGLAGYFIGYAVATLSSNRKVSKGVNNGTS